MQIIKIPFRWLIHNYNDMRANWRRIKSTWRSKRAMQSYGKGLRVNFPCTFGGFVTVGDYCNFNGMKVLGGGVKSTLVITSTRARNA